MRQRDIATARRRAQEAARLLELAQYNATTHFHDYAQDQAGQAAALMRKAADRLQQLLRDQLRGKR